MGYQAKASYRLYLSPDWSAIGDLDHALAVLPAPVYECECDETTRVKERLGSRCLLARERLKEGLCAEKSVCQLCECDI